MIIPFPGLCLCCWVKAQSVHSTLTYTCIGKEPNSWWQKEFPSRACSFPSTELLGNISYGPGRAFLALQSWEAEGEGQSENPLLVHSVSLSCTPWLLGDQSSLCNACHGWLLTALPSQLGGSAFSTWIFVQADFDFWNIWGRLLLIILFKTQDDYAASPNDKSSIPHTHFMPIAAGHSDK